MVLEIPQHEPSEAARIRRETYNLREFSTLTGIKLTAIRRGIREQDLPVLPVRIGGQWMFPRRPVDRLLGIEDGD